MQGKWSGERSEQEICLGKQIKLGKIADHLPTSGCQKRRGSKIEMEREIDRESSYRKNISYEILFSVETSSPSLHSVSIQHLIFQRFDSIRSLTPLDVRSVSLSPYLPISFENRNRRCPSASVGPPGEGRVDWARTSSSECELLGTRKRRILSAYEGNRFDQGGHQPQPTQRLSCLAHYGTFNSAT